MVPRTFRGQAVVVLAQQVRVSRFFERVCQGLVMAVHVELSKDLRSKGIKKLIRRSSKLGWEKTSTTKKKKEKENTYSKIKHQSACAAQPVGHIPDQIRPLRRVQEN